MINSEVCGFCGGVPAQPPQPVPYCECEGVLHVIGSTACKVCAHPLKPIITTQPIVPLNPCPPAMPPAPVTLEHNDDYIRLGMGDAQRLFFENKLVILDKFGNAVHSLGRKGDYYVKLGPKKYVWAWCVKGVYPMLSSRPYTEAEFLTQVNRSKMSWYQRLDKTVERSYE